MPSKLSKAIQPLPKIQSIDILGSAGLVQNCRNLIALGPCLPINPIFTVYFNRTFIKALDTVVLFVCRDNEAEIL